jgi:hypothetical protein
MVHHKKSKLFGLTRKKKKEEGEDNPLESWLKGRGQIVLVK